MARIIPRTQIWTYALAFLGAHLAFMPLFVLLLPRHVEALAPENTGVVLSWLLLTGGLVAGVANVAAGAVGDRWLERFGNRRGLIAIGAALLACAYVAFAFADTIRSLFAALIFFQISLNCCFSPLGALLADHFPNEVKGRQGGLLTAALPTSTLLVLPIAWLFPEDDPMGFVLVGSLVTLCLVPLLWTWALGPVIAGQPVQETDPSASDAGTEQSPPLMLLTDFSLAWVSRFLVQAGSALVIGYVYLYIASMSLNSGAWQGAGASEILAGLTVPTALLSIVATLCSGSISDRIKSRRTPLSVFAGLFGLGMGMLAVTSDLIWFFVGYGVLQCALAAYLSVDAALIAQLVSGHRRRGLLLGVMNLANTLPSVIVPSIALLAFKDQEIVGVLTTLFAAFALTSLLAGALILMIRGVR